MKLSFVIWVALSIPFYVNAKSLSTVEKKTAFATAAVGELLLSKGDGFRLVPNSIRIGDCEGAINKIGSALAYFSSECNTVTFNTWDRQGKLYSGKLHLTTAKSDSKLAKDAKKYTPGLKSTEYQDEKSKIRIYLGLFSMNSKIPDAQTTAELLSLVMSNSAPSPQPANGAN